MEGLRWFDVITTPTMTELSTNEKDVYGYWSGTQLPELEAHHGPRVKSTEGVLIAYRSHQLTSTRATTTLRLMLMINSSKPVVPSHG